MKHATINDAPPFLNTNDKAMWVLGFNAALTGAQPAAPSAAEFVLSDVDPVVLAIWKMQGRKVGAMLRESSAAIEELSEELENAKDAAPAAQPADSAMEVLRELATLEDDIYGYLLANLIDRARALVAKETPHG